MDFLWYLVTTMKNYYPFGLGQVIVYNVSRVLRPLWNVVKLWLGSELNVITFANGKEIKNLIPLDQLLRYLGGNAEHDFTVAPASCKSIVELGPKYKLTAEEVEKIVKIFEPNINEAQRLIGNFEMYF